MAKRKSSLFDNAFGWLFRLTRGEAQLRIGEFKRGAQFSPLTEYEEEQRREMARGYKIETARRTRRYRSTRAGATRSALRSKYERDLNRAGIDVKRRPYISPRQASVISQLERRRRK